MDKPKPNPGNVFGKRQISRTPEFVAPSEVVMARPITEVSSEANDSERLADREPVPTPAFQFVIGKVVHVSPEKGFGFCEVVGEDGHKQSVHFYLDRYDEYELSYGARPRSNYDHDRPAPSVRAGGMIGLAEITPSTAGRAGKSAHASGWTGVENARQLNEQLRERAARYPVGVYYYPPHISLADEYYRLTIHNVDPKTGEWHSDVNPSLSGGGEAGGRRIGEMWLWVKEPGEFPHGTSRFGGVIPHHAMSNKPPREYEEIPMQLVANASEARVAARAYADELELRGYSRPSEIACLRELAEAPAIEGWDSEVNRLVSYRSQIGEYAAGGTEHVLAGFDTQVDQDVERQNDLRILIQAIQDGSAVRITEADGRRALSIGEFMLPTNENGDILHTGYDWGWPVFQAGWEVYRLKEADYREKTGFSSEFVNDVCRMIAEFGDAIAYPSGGLTGSSKFALTDSNVERLATSIVAGLEKRSAALEDHIAVLCDMRQFIEQNGSSYPDLYSLEIAIDKYLRENGTRQIGSAALSAAFSTDKEVSS